MRKLKFSIIGILSILFMIPNVEATIQDAPKNSFDCTYYIYGDVSNTENEVPLSSFLQNNGFTDDKKIPKLHVKYTVDDNKNTWNEAVYGDSKNLTIEVIDLTEGKKFDMSFSGYYMLYTTDSNGNQLILEFRTNDFPFKEDVTSTCPTLYYNYIYDPDYNTTTLTFTTTGSTNNLSISTDIPNELPEDEKPNISEEEQEIINQTKYCKFNYVIKNFDYVYSSVPIDLSIPICIRKRNNKLEYAVKGDVQCDNIQGYQSIEKEITYNMKDVFADYGGINVNINLAGIEEDIYESDDGGIVCPQAVDIEWDTAGGIKIDYERFTVITGKKFERLVSNLQVYLAIYAEENNFSTSKYGELNLNGNIKRYPWIDNLSNDIEYNKDKLEYIVHQKMTNIQKYCIELYGNYNNFRSASEIYTRLDECIQFEKFYKDGAEAGLFEDYTSSCGFVTNDLKEKLTWVLDIIKIAGPLMALGLGMFDFFKAIASGDTDKEMKSVFKRFMIRIVSAILLLVLPIILSFLLDIFLDNKDGYDSENPFCNLVDWDEIK